MLLYHFTTRDLVRPILRGGLSLGTVRTSSTETCNAVWLTTAPGSEGHGLEMGGEFMGQLERREAGEWSGRVPPPGARFPKEASARITVEIDAGDKHLHEWLPWARRHMTPDWFAHLHPVALGNLKKAKTWRLYFGVIPPSAFVAVEDITGAAPTEIRPQLRLVS